MAGDLGTTLGTMLINLSDTLGVWGQVLPALAYIMGIGLFLKAMYSLRLMGDHRHMMFQPMDIKAPIITMICGAALIYSPTFIDVTTATLWGSDRPLTYSEPGDDYWRDLWNASFIIIRLIGFMAFVRGWLIMARAGGSGHGGGQDTFSKAFTHIIGGVLCYHIDATLLVLSNTFGIELSDVITG